MRALLFLLVAIPATTQTSLEAKGAQARDLMQQGRFAEAAAVYGEMVKAAPGNPGLLMNQGIALHMAGQDAAAIGPLEAALKVKPIPPALLFLGASYLRTGQPAKAIAPLEKFAAVEPDHKESRAMLADAATQAGQPAKAAVHLRRIAELEPADPNVWYNLGRAYESLATMSFEAIPQATGYWLALAADSRSKGNQNRAAFLLYRQAIEKLPRHRGLHAAVAGIYRRTGHEDWAAQEDAREKALGEPACKAAATLECHFAAGRFARITASPLKTPEAAYWKTRAYDALSREAFEKLAALPVSAQLHRFRAEVAAARGQFPAALEAWKQAAALAPQDLSLQYEIALGEIRARNYEAAQAIVTRYIGMDPDSPELNYLQGDILLNQQQPDKALPFLEKAAQADPRMLPARATLGRALLLAGRGAAAVPHLETALPIDDDASLHFQLARAYQSAGDAEKARTAMAAYQKLKASLDAQTVAAEDAAQITPPQ